MLKQNVLRLSVRPVPGETSRNQQFRVAELRQHLRDSVPKAVPAEKLFCDLLKRQAREAMAAVTECPAVSMPYALAGLASVRGVIRAAMAGGFVPACEMQRSGHQLTAAHTLADYLECIELTRREHRAPVFLNSRDAEISAIHHKIDLLASMVACALPESFEMPAAFCPEESGVQS